MKVPFVDLKLQYNSIEDEIKNAINDVLEDMSFIQGPFVSKFEEEFCKIHGLTSGVGCANGTVAITAALRILGVGAGDEVVVPANTFFATAEAVVEVGATPVLCDCRSDSYGIDVESLKNVLTEKTKAVIPVHLYGTPSDMHAVMKVARENDLKVIEDTAQAHLAKIGESPVGMFGDFCTFSFYPGKNLGAYGDAGFIGSKDQVNIEKVRKYINHGRTNKYEHDEFGTNYRMDGIQAAVLSVKTKYLGEWTRKRQAAAMKYDETFKSNGFKTIEPLENATSVYHLYVVEVSNREEVINHLKENDIQSGIHYPVPLNKQMAFSTYPDGRKSFPIAEKTSNRVLSLPMFPEITDAQIRFVSEKFLEVADF